MFSSLNSFQQPHAGLPVIFSHIQGDTPIFDLNCCAILASSLQGTLQQILVGKWLQKPV